MIRKQIFKLDDYSFIKTEVNSVYLLDKVYTVQYTYLIEIFNYC